MTDPWSILQIPKETATEPLVRAAYARLLKQHRPDQDPVGFKTLRAAYERALEHVRRGTDDLDDETEGLVKVLLGQHFERVPEFTITKGTTASPDRDEEPVPAPRPEQELEDDWNWPREWTYGIESLEKALLLVEAEPRRTTVALYALAMDAVDFAMPAGVLDVILLRAFGARVGLFVPLAPRVLIELLLSGGALRALDAALDHLTEPQHEPHRVMLARRLEQIPSKAINQTNFAFLCRVALSVAFDAQAPARSLQQKLLLKPEAHCHRAMLEELRQALHQSSLLQNLGKHSRRFWLQRLHDPDAPCQWRGKAAVQALREVVLKGRQWSGGAMLQKLTPATIWRRAWSERWWLVLAAGTRKTVRHPAFAFGLVIIAVFGWLAVLHHMKNRQAEERRELIRRELGDEFFYNLLSRQLGRTPTLEEIRQFGDELDALQEKQGKKLPKIEPLRE